MKVYYVQLSLFHMELEVDFEYTIIGIKTVLDDYQLAFNLNKELNTYFVRSKNDIDVQDKSENELSYYSHFVYENTEEMEEWHLISNKYNTENKFSEKAKEESQDLFSLNNQVTQITKYFIPEKKELNYLLRIDYIENKRRIDELINKIRSVTAITTAFSIQYNTLRSKQNLIF